MAEDYPLGFGWPVSLKCCEHKRVSFLVLRCLYNGLDFQRVQTRRNPDHCKACPGILGDNGGGSYEGLVTVLIVVQPMFFPFPLISLQS